MEYNGIRVKYEEYDPNTHKYVSNTTKMYSNRRLSRAVYNVTVGACARFTHALCEQLSISAPSAAHTGPEAK